MFAISICYAQTNNKFEITGITEAQLRPFLSNLRLAIKNNDKILLSKMVHYPLSVYSSNSKSVKIKNPIEFTRKYDSIVNSKVKSAIINQDFDSLFCNWQGVMIGSGELWLSKIVGSDSIYIITINK